jgi:hypothetical protein
MLKNLAQDVVFLIGEHNLKNITESTDLMFFTLKYIFLVLLTCSSFFHNFYPWENVQHSHKECKIIYKWNFLADSRGPAHLVLLLSNIYKGVEPSLPPPPIPPPPRPFPVFRLITFF